jgi:hypothetical protein
LSDCVVHRFLGPCWRSSSGITSTERVCRNRLIKLCVMVIMSSCRVLLVSIKYMMCCGWNASGWLLYYRNSVMKHHCHTGCKRDVLMKRITFTSSVPSHVYAGLHLLKWMCAFTSSVPSGVQSMKRMTFALLVPSHVYPGLHLLELFCCLHLISA